MKRTLVPLVALAAACATIPRGLETAGSPELFSRGIVSTPASEVRITFSPDGSRMLWGSTNRPGGPGGWDLWESVREGETWGPPHAVPFDSPENDFDPSFAPDGSGVYFFSNRPGGLGGDDLWMAPYDAASGTYGSAVNLGPAVNSAGDEWAPVVHPDGKRLLFATDGRGGRGLHDLFVSVREAGRWLPARPVEGEINSADDDFDATYLHDGETIVLTRRRKDQDGADLLVSFRKGAGYGAARPLPASISLPGGWNLGPSIHPGERGWLYFTSHRPDDTAGRLDIYRIRYSASGTR
jgi:TolB protein